MNPLTRFRAELDLHIVAMLVLLVPIALVFGASASASERPVWQVLSVLAIIPQFRVVTPCIDIRRFGRSPLPYLLANELILALAAGAAIFLHTAFRGIYPR